MLPQLPRLAAGRTQPMLLTVHAFDKAHAVMLVEEGLLPPAAGAAILRALRQMEKEGVGEGRTPVGGGLHPGQQYLIPTLPHDGPPPRPSPATASGSPRSR